jgi:hypothetical protein
MSLELVHLDFILALSRMLARFRATANPSVLDGGSIQSYSVHTMDVDEDFNTVFASTTSNTIAESTMADSLDSSGEFVNTVIGGAEDIYDDRIDEASIQTFSVDGMDVDEDFNSYSSTALSDITTDDLAVVQHMVHNIMMAYLRSINVDVTERNALDTLEAWIRESIDAIQLFDMDVDEDYMNDTASSNRTAGSLDAVWQMMHYMAGEQVVSESNDANDPIAYDYNGMPPP